MAGKKKSKPPEEVVNRKAKREYEILETLEAGIELMGTEVKALRGGLVSLAEAYVKATPNGLVLEGAHFGEYVHANVHNHPAMRSRRLLVHKSEAFKLNQKLKEKGLTMIPMRMYFSGRWAKVEIALGRGRRLHDKRQVIKDREAKRDIRRHMK
ncbi:MAG: SsrA-binding protein SmpB [Planctomycetes bacterium]|nr:SsrA-binding protein SmpB [Planctomycetota bacterium]MCP4770835.1 SsrA-binding protein SmpB [Planctomycetota bacterium]MCP4860211.1 SsrA-binding protein SmpB [Planctomycetota bacterium]